MVQFDQQRPTAFSEPFDDPCLPGRPTGVEPDAHGVARKAEEAAQTLTDAEAEVERLKARLESLNE